MVGIDSGAHMKNFTLRSPSFFFFLLVIFDIIWLNLYKHSYFVMPCLTKNCGVAFCLLLFSFLYIFLILANIIKKGAVGCQCCLVVDGGIRAYVMPFFTHELEERNVSEGGTISLIARVEAYPAVGVLWYMNNNNNNKTTKQTTDIR